MVKNYIQLIRADKPIGTLLLLWPTISALFVAARGVPPLYAMVVFSFGVFLTRAAGCAINDVFDADFDKHVRRTQNRPIARGVIGKKQGICVCLLLSALAFILAYTFLSTATLYYTIPALLVFITYPLMKRICPFPQAYLGIAFSFGILMAFVEINGSTSYLAWLCFSANLFWVLGYDTIYALEDIQDDVGIGIKTSALTLGKYVVGFVAACYVTFVGLLILLGMILHIGILYYLALVVSAILLSYQIMIIQFRKRYLPMFLLNNWVGFIVFAGLVMSLH